MNRPPPQDSSAVRPERGSRGRIVGVGGLVLVTLLGLAGGPSGALLFGGLYLLVTGLWAVVRRGSWLGRSSRGGGWLTAAVAFALVVVGVVIAPPSTSATPDAESLSHASPTDEPSPTPSPDAEPSPTPTEPTLEERAAELPAPELAPAVDVTAATSTAAPQTALATVALLEVKGRAPKTGYERDLFGGGWLDPDRNGCDARNDILRRDLTGTTLKAGTNDCVVLTGALADPYSGGSIDFTRGQETSSDVQIDHVVALSDAWQKGAQSWDAPKREAFANDPMNLLAVDGPLNMQKGDGDTATWLPPNKPFRCQYVARQVGVKYTYGVWVTEAERSAMVSVLSTCPSEPLPQGSAIPPAPVAPAPAPVPVPVVIPAPAPAPAPAPVPAPAPAPEPAPAAPSVYYKNCTAARDAGAAPVHLGDPGYGTHLDRDGDGIGCE